VLEKVQFGAVLVPGALEHWRWERWMRRFGYANLRRATRIDILGRQISRYGKTGSSVISNQFIRRAAFQAFLFSPQHYPEKERFEG